METSLPVMNAEGQDAGSVDLNEQWLESERGEQAVHDCIVAFLNARRAGSASTKTRREVRGGGAKPYRQKGTGRARAGSVRSPLWRGGGTTFGPRPRKYVNKVNRKVKTLALRRTLAERVADEAVTVVDSIQLEEPRSRLLRDLLARLGAGQNVLVVVDKLDRNLRLAARNFTNVNVMESGSVNPYWLLRHHKVLFSKAGLESFGERLV